MLEEIGVRRRRGLQRIRWLDGITNSVDMSLCKTPWISDGQGGLACCDSWVAKSDTTKGLNWTEPIWRSFRSLFHWMSFIPYYLFLLLWDFNDASLRSCLLSHKSFRFCSYIFSSLFFFSWELHWFIPTFPDSILCHLQCITESIQCIICSIMFLGSITSVSFF